MLDTVKQRLLEIDQALNFLLPFGTAYAKAGKTFYSTFPFALSGSKPDFLEIFRRAGIPHLKDIPPLPREYRGESSSKDNINTLTYYLLHLLLNRNTKK